MSDPAALPITILATSLGFVVVQLDGSILNVALPQIGISLGTSVDGLQWTGDAYFLVFAVLLLSTGVLSDRMGARRAFVSGFTVFSAASLACTLAPSPVALIGARAVQGAGEPCWFHVRLPFSTTLAAMMRGCGRAQSEFGRRLAQRARQQARFWVVCWLALSAGGAFALGWNQKTRRSLRRVPGAFGNEMLATCSSI